MIRYKKDTDNIVTLTLDMKGREVNVLNHKLSLAFEPVLVQLKKEKEAGELTGIIITSAKKTFMVGGDLEYLHKTYDAKEIFGYTQDLKRFFRTLEFPGVPAVAALNGTALGAGFELALSCHYRIALSNSKIRFGHPEVHLGIMPGGGALVRLMWLLGIEKAFEVVAEGKRYTTKEAFELGLIDDVADNQEGIINKAKKWILKNNDARRPWDRKERVIPFGSALELDIARKIRYMASNLSQATRNNFDAPAVILQTLAEASKVDFDTASRIESRAFTRLVSAQRAKNMTQAFWYDYNAIKNGAYRPKGIGKFRFKKIGIIGSGRMGSGIALACVRRGIDVVIKDVSEAVAAKAKVVVLKDLEILKNQGRLTKEELAKFSDQIKITEEAKDFQDCDIVIEAVFENEKVKTKVLKETEANIDEYTVFATNTSSIPISTMADQAKYPENFVGIHFFSPVETVPLVEIVRGKKTSDETVAKAVDFVQRIKKTPIISKDSWGFYVSRVKNTYLLEGIELLRQGYPAALIENAGFQCGMPRGPLAQTDEIGLELSLSFETQAGILYGPKYIQHPAVSVLEKMINVFKRVGGHQKNGFYNYDLKGNSIELWKDLANHFSITQKDCDVEEIKDRLLFVQVIEAAWCMQEKVILSEAEANLGSIYGWGFPSFSGGVLQYVDSIGKDIFIEKCKRFEEKHGPRFKIPKYLLRQEE